MKVQSDFLKYLTPLHCVLPFLPFPSQQPGLSALNRKKPGKGRPQKKEGHGWLLLGQRKNGFAVLTFCIAVTTGTIHIEAFGPDLVQARNKISFCIETGDRLGSSWFSISRDRFEYTVSLGHTYSYPRSPLQATIDLSMDVERHIKRRLPDEDRSTLNLTQPPPNSQQTNK